MIKLSDRVTTKKTAFCDSLDLKDVIPDRTDAVILLSNDGTGFKTHGVHLPHQIYTFSLEILAERGAKEFFILPFYSNVIVRIGEKK